MHALIVDALPAETRAGLEGLGLRVTQDTSLSSHSLAGAVADVDILIVGRTRVTRRTIEAASNLRLIIRAGSGADTIDLDAASQRGIFISHCPAADASARAELVFGYLLALDRRLRADFGADQAAVGLRGRSLGLYGLDATARRVAAIGRGFGMRVHVYDEALTTALASEARVHRCAGPGELFRRAEIVSLHPDTDTDGPLVGADEIGALADGAVLINISRRGLIDLAAARARLDAGTLSLALDVYDSDDYGDDVPFAADAYPGLLTTDRIASQTSESADAIASAVVDHVEKFLRTDSVPDCLNCNGESVDATTLLVRFRHAEGVLASILGTLAESNVKVNAVHTQLFSNCAAAFARITIDNAPDPTLLAAIRRNPKVIQLDHHS